MGTVCLRVVVLCMLLAAGNAGADPGGEGDNLAPNPGFEEATADGTQAAVWGAAALLTEDAHSGKRAARLVAEGRKPALFQRYLEGVRSGRLTFWYKAVRGVSEAEPKPETNLSLHVVPINEQGREYPSFRRERWDIPAAHIGDGQWHQGELRFNYLDAPAVRGVYVGPRINEMTTQTMPTGAGEVLFDDLLLLPLGPQPRVEPLRLVETPGREGEEATLVCEVANDGDAPLRALSARAAARGLKVTPILDRAASLEPLTRAELKWTITGKRAARSLPISVQVRAQGLTPIRAELTCRPLLEIRELTLPRSVLWHGERTRASAVLANAGTATASGVKVSLRLPRGVKCVGGMTEIALGSLPPGASHPLAWSLLGDAPVGPAPVAVRVSAKNAGSAADARDLVVSRRAGAPAGTAAGADDLVFGNAGMRLLFPRNPMGYGVAEVQLRQAGVWRSLAVMPHLGRIRFRGAGGQIEEHAFTASSAVPGKQGNSATLALAGAWRDSRGATWRHESLFSLASGAGSAEVSLAVAVDQPRDLLLCEGPVLLVGEGTTGKAKDLALFPGLDFVGPDEPSNQVWNPRVGERDGRVAPDPLKITIPFMGVSHRGAAVGLMWNALDRWDGEHDRVSARFLSPDFEERRDHHHLSLFVPTVPDWVPENTREAAKPYRLTPGKGLCFRFRVVAREGTVLDLQRDWLDAYGVPEVPENRWSYEEYARLAVDAENKLRYEPERHAWQHTNTVKPGEGQFNPQLCTDMWLESQRTTDPQRREFLRQRVLEASKPHAGRIELSLPFHIGLMEPALEGVRKWSLQIMERQLPEGGWGLKKREGLPEWIGKDGTVASGTCAYEALRLMRYARITGAPDVYAAARRGLAALEKDPIPRGGQVWEVPVQVADIIVAGFASEAYLDAYRITGDPKDLERALYWAKTGVHFIYLWEHPGQPVMLGATIPVYGNDWFARPVQWCGREILEPMLDLAEIDDSLPWRRLSECIAVSFMQQTLGPDFRMYPDTAATPEAKLHWTYPYEGWSSFDKCAMQLIDNFWLDSPRRFPCWFLTISPTRATPLRQGFVDSLWRLMGADPRPDTKVLRAGEDRIHLSAAGKVADARLSPAGEVSFRVQYSPGETAHALVAGLSAPTRVTCAGRELPAVADMDTVPEGWCRHRGLLLLKLRDAGDVLVTISGAKPERPLHASASQ